MIRLDKIVLKFEISVKINLGFICLTEGDKTGFLKGLFDLL